MKNNFNPVKEEKDGVRAKRVIWSTKALEAALAGLNEGHKLVANPFYENNPKLLKGDLVFNRTKEEIEEWKKCADDVLYFATKCQLLTPEGIKHIKLRDYQSRYLKHLDNHNFSIYLACRQCGKCVFVDQLIKIRFEDNFWNTVGKNKTEYLKKYYIKRESCYNIPLFELMNLYWTGPIWKQKYRLYQRIQKDSGIATSYDIYKEIEKLDQVNDVDYKLVKTHILNGVLVKSDEGFTPAAMIHETKPYIIYELVTENGLVLRGADEHLIFDDSLNGVYMRDLRNGQKIITENGIDTVKTITKTDIKVSMCDITVLNDKESYFTNGILSHNTTTSAIYMLWYVLFRVDKNALVLGDKRKTALEIMDKIKKIFLELPFYLKPGIYKWNENSIAFDNGCRIMAEATTINSGIGFSLHCVLWDEASHCAPNIMDKFYNNLFPTITAGGRSKENSGDGVKFMITSTQNGYNLFYRLYKAAEQGLNDYAPFKTDWDEVPEWNPDKKCWEKRDEAWHQRQVANYGSEEAFNAQFGTNFDVNANTLIDTKLLRNKQRESIEFINKDLYGVSNSQYFFWKPDYEPMEDLRKDFITVTIDIAEGIGGDYTIFNFNRMTKKGDEVIGFFRANTVSLDNAVLTLMEVDKYMHPLHHCISLEYNTYGELFISKMREQRDKYPHVSNFDESNFVKYYNESMSSYRIGIKLTSNSKPIGCKLFKEQYEKGIIENISTVFLAEMENFSDSSGNGVYKASFGHDDEVMATIQLVYAKQSNAYKYLRSEFDSLLGLGITTAENIQTLQSGVQQEQASVNLDGYFDPTKVFNNMNDIYASMASNQQDFYMSRLR